MYFMLARISSVILTRNDESEHLSLVHNLGGHIFSTSLSMILSSGFPRCHCTKSSIWVLVRKEVFVLKLWLLDFITGIFFFIIGTIILFFSFILLRWPITSIDAQMLRQIGIPGTNPPNHDVVS